MDHSLTTGSVWKKLLLFAIPVLGANLLQALYGTVDLMIVGMFSDAAAVSAVSTGSMTMQTLTGIITGLTMGSTVLLGQNIGRRDNAAASRTVISSFTLFTAVGILLTIIICFTAYGLAGIMNAPAEAFSETVSYVRICGGGILFIVMFNALGGMFRGIGDSATPLILMGIACAANIILDLLFVAGFDMSAAGAAFATVIAQGISVVSAVFMIRKKGFGFEMEKQAMRPAKAEAWKILQYGLPIAAQDALTGVSFMVILAILNGFGLVASAGVGVGEKICGIMFIVPGAVMASVSAFSAQNVGAGKYDRARQGMFIAMAFAAIIGVLMFLVSFTNGVILAGFFTRDMDVRLAAADYLRSYSIDCILVAFVFSMMGYLNGHGKTGFVALQGILSTFLVRIPVSYLMSKIPGVSLFQVGFATPLASIFSIVIIVIYMIRFKKTNSER